MAHSEVVLKDSRTSSEIDWCIRICFAVGYLRYVKLDGIARQLAENWMHDDPKKWAGARINLILSRANAVAREHVIGAYARSLVAESLAELDAHRRELGLVEAE